MQSFLTASTMEETWISRMRLLLGHRGEELLPPALELRGRRVLDVGGEAPPVTGGIVDRGEAVAPEHVGHRHHHLGPRPHRAGEGRVDVGHVQVERAGGVAGRDRRDAAHARDSSASMMRESPTWISACMILPSGEATRMISRAPKARW